MDEGDAPKALAFALILVLLTAGLVLPHLNGSGHAESMGPDGFGTTDAGGGGLLAPTLTQGFHVFLPLSMVHRPQRTHLPFFVKYFGPKCHRLGYCATDADDPISRYPDIRRLAAGWYVNFKTEQSPDRPLGMEFVQTVRLHQVTECWPERTRDRDACPYVTPYTYTLTYPSNREEIVATAQAVPGSLWLIGNEMDRHDWEGGGQDEMLPGLYAQAYHEFYHLVKAADPTAQVAIGGVSEPTPARLEYLTTVWDSYKASYGEDMPVDVWNIHNFILKEIETYWGADVPPGCTILQEDTHGRYGGRQYAPFAEGEERTYEDREHDDLEIFDNLIRAFRQWMKERGQQNKPLIVSEYGILYWHEDEDGRVFEDFGIVRDFMLATFDYFMNTVDCDLGYLADDCRLVQRWAWYSLDDSRGVFNNYAYLFHLDTREMTALGEAYTWYAQSHLDTW